MFLRDTELRYLGEWAVHEFIDEKTGYDGRICNVRDMETYRDNANAIQDIRERRFL